MRGFLNERVTNLAGASDHAAPLAAFGNLTSNDFFSARVGCQTYGIYGMDLAALCLRSSQNVSHN